MYSTKTKLTFDLFWISTLLLCIIRLMLTLLEEKVTTGKINNIFALTKNVKALIIN